MGAKVALKSRLVITMTQDKETKGAVRYAADDESGAEILPTLYVRKEAFPDGDIPTSITVTVEKN